MTTEEQQESELVMNKTRLYSHKLIWNRVTPSKLRSALSLGILADHTKERIAEVLPGWIPSSFPLTPVTPLAPLQSLFP